MTKPVVRLLFVHGWGFSPSFWQEIQKAFPDIPIHSIDLGFVRSEDRTDINLDFLYHQKESVVAIGHSLGFFYLLRKSHGRFRAYVAINSFSRFSKHQDFPNGIDVRILNRMSKGLQQNGMEVLRRFYSLCGLHGSSFLSFPGLSSDFLSLDRLEKGLDWLKTEDYRLLLPEINQKLTVIASLHDPVVPAAMTRDSFPECRCQWIEDNTHLLPLTRPLDCIKTIRNVIDHV